MTIEDLIRQKEEIEARIEKMLASAESQKPKSEPSAEIVAQARELNPIDDIFFNKMGESAEVCEEIISTILQCPVRVLRVVPQNTIASLQGRGVRLDALADVKPVIRVKAELLADCPIGKKGAKVNIEVQKDDNDDHQKRALFNAAAIIMNETPKGTKKFRDVPDVVVIFISKFDVFKKGKMYYKINRVIEGLGDVVHNGMSEYYVNAAVKDRSTEEMSKIADLMEVFVESDRYDYEQFPKTSERKNQFKNTEEGVRAMSDGLEAFLEAMAEKRANEREQQTRVLDIRNLMGNLKLTLEQAMDALNIPQADQATYAGLVRERL